MCGIAGFWRNGGGELSAVDMEEVCRRLNHRGPDDRGVWQDKEAEITLGHVRLAIVDLTPAGQQPMHSACGRFVLVFNGEIYNHHSLRCRLEESGMAPAWRGHSDTETLLASFSAWGVEVTLKTTVGMFALALWDRKSRRLHLARDRLGEKPLYYGFLGGALAFASELKALRKLPGFDGQVDRGALAVLMRHNYIPAPYSIYRGIHKLLPGTLLTVSEENLHRRTFPSPIAYWSALDAALDGTQNPLAFANESEAVDALEARLRESIGLQMVADVPLGAFLSGGIDSSTVVALMQAQSARPIKTFSIGFHEEGYDEARYAKTVARHLGTDHTELYVSHQDALAVIPRLPILYDEPFSDSSQIPTYLVAQLARRRVAVVLSGDGGDELFCGYSRYLRAALRWGRIQWIPLPLRRALAAGIRAIPPAGWDALHKAIFSLAPARDRLGLPGDKLHKGAKLLTKGEFSLFYRDGFMCHWEPADLVTEMSEPPSQLNGSPVLLPPTERMMLLDAMSYLPDDILVKVDRACMATSLESRVPFLDHRVFEFAWRLPMEYKLRDGVGKWLLRQVLFKYVPRELVERPKRGFGVPIGDWLRGPLRDWAEALLDEARLRQEGYLNPYPIRKKWNEHLSGRCNWQYHLWDVLMFQAWLEEHHS